MSRIRFYLWNLGKRVGIDSFVQRQTQRLQRLGFRIELFVDNHHIDS
jgi:hypothetical protein